MEGIVVTGIGSYLPTLMHTNETLPPLDTPISSSDIEKVGVFRRGWAGEGEGIAEMAAHAARKACAQANFDPSSLDLIILANWTQRRYIPEFAPRLQHMLGASRAAAYDIATACTGFVYGCASAHGFLQNPRFSRALVVAAETTSQRGRPHSKSTLIFGDAAGAFVLEKQSSERGGRILDYELKTFGDQHHIMDISPEGWVRTHIKQQELIELTSRCFAELAAAILARNGISLRDVDWIVPHSGTAGVQAALVRTLEVPKEKVLTNFSSVGNVSSAAIPVALDEFIASGKIKKGDLIFSPAVGTGFYAAALLYRA
jgi:3-oxoacyl-[acyl-carrier-protein] synthase III